MKFASIKTSLVLFVFLLITGTNSYSAQPPVPHQGLSKFQTGLLLGLSTYLYGVNWYCMTHNGLEAIGFPRADIGGICHQVPGSLPIRIVQHVAWVAVLGPIVSKLSKSLYL